jgi:isocitrate dehydrogenase kinase/phosphatase
MSGLKPTAIPIERAYVRLRGCVNDVDKLAAAAQLILTIFDALYVELCEYPYLSKRPFETMDPRASVQVSKERLGLYSQYMADHGPRIKAATRI